MLFVLPLDMVMSVVFMSDRQGTERARMRRVLWIEAALLATLVASWTPFLADLLERAG